MMKYIYILLVGVILSGCGSQKPVPSTNARWNQRAEEKVVMQSFFTFIATSTYDDVCNKEDSKSELEYLENNRQMITKRFVYVWHRRHPDKDIKGVTQLLTKTEKDIDKAYREIIQKQGCDSDDSKVFAQLYDIYSTSTPEQVSRLIDGKIDRDSLIVMDF